ncbi:hypothetical protein EBT31_13120 [bacterium]|nr:hypothetical protein [bacterium]
MTKKQTANQTLLEMASQSIRILVARGQKPEPIDTATNLAMWDLISGVKPAADIILDTKIRKCEAELNLKKLELDGLLAEREARNQGKDLPTS